MRFLIEKSLIDQEKEFKLLNASPNQKRKEAEKTIDKLPNAKNLQAAKTIYIDSLVEDGFDDSKNKFITFMNRVPYPVNIDIARLVKVLLAKNQLTDINADWLYNDSLYSDKDSISFKIKALTYVDNKSLQLGADTQITPLQLMDDGVIKSATDIEEILREISVAAAKRLGEFTNEEIETLDLTETEETAFRKYIAEHRNDTAHNIKDAYAKYLASDKTKADAKKQADAEEKAQAKVANKGYTILKNAIKSDDLNIQNVRDYVADLWSDKKFGNISEIVLPKEEATKQLNSGEYDDVIDKILKKNIISPMGRDPKELLDNELVDKVSSTWKRKSGLMKR